MKIGSTTINNCKIGNVQVNEVRIGSTLVWSNTPAYDVDAMAYFAANTAITSTLDKDAINAYFVGLKTDGIYSKIRAMYLPIWSSAANNKWNLKDPRDLDAAFRLSFFGGWTHTGSGIFGNATTTHIDTSFNAVSQSLNVNSFSISFYSNTDDNRGIDVGADTTSCFYFCAKSNVVADRARFFTSNALDYLSDPNTLGHYVATQQNSTSKKMFKNNLSYGVSTDLATGTFANHNVTFGALNRDNIPQFRTAKRYTFFHIGNGLTDLDISNLTMRTQNLMIYFGIQI